MMESVDEKKTLSLVESPCQDVCPISLRCHAYISSIKEGNIESAYRAIRQRLAFPMTLGRICDKPCEIKCRRALVDDTIAIRHLKRFIADYAHKNAMPYRPRIKANRRERVGIIGSGPAGLSAAYDLAREGFMVTVFEALPVAGGMMAVGCPEYKLPKKILQSEIQNVTSLGVDIRLNCEVTDIDSLFGQGYKAIFVATGMHQGKKLDIPNADLKDTWTAVSFLREVNLGKAVKSGKRVVVLGGGDVALDCARTALRLGTTEVHLACVESRDKLPAKPWELVATQEEGVIIHPSLTCTSILARGGEVTGVECLRVRRAEFDNNGKLHVDTIEQSQEIIYADTVIFAIGQLPDLRFASGKLVIGSKGLVEADPYTLETSAPGVFAGGDAVTNAGSVVKAIAHGQRAALSITEYLNGEKPSPKAVREDDEPVYISTRIPTEEDLRGQQSQVAVTFLPTEQRRSSFDEVTLSYSVEEAQAEATRCLRCDLVETALSQAVPVGEGSLDEQAAHIRKEGMGYPAGLLRRGLIGGLQLRPKPSPEKVENVVMTGCGVWGTPYPLISFCRTLKYFEVPFTFLPTERCCGANMWVSAVRCGSEIDKKRAEKFSAEFCGWNIAQIKSLGAKNVWYMCHWCVYFVRAHFGQTGLDLSSHLDVLMRLLREFQPRLEFKGAVGYFPGGRHRKQFYVPGLDFEFNWSAYRDVLNRIKGLTVVDLPPYCCVTHPQMTMKALEEHGLSMLVTPCITCYGRLLRKAPPNVTVMGLDDLILEALPKRRE